MLKRTYAVFTWAVNLFNPPPLNSLTFSQKAGRVFLLTATLVIGSILVAMLGALGLFIIEKGREIDSTPEMLNGLGILVVGILVNIGCVWVLFQLKRADHKLVPPKEKGAGPTVFLKIEPEELKEKHTDTPADR